MAETHDDGGRSRAARVVILVNRRAHGLTGEGGGSRALLDVLTQRRAGVRVVETRSLAELDEAAAAIARDVPDAVVLAGGDGSTMAGVTALAAAFVAAGRGEEELPPIALAPGGTVCTVARNWGFPRGGLLRGGAAHAARHTARLLEAITAGRATTTRRPTLRVVDDHAERVGFIVGAGLVSRFFEIYDREGARGTGSAAGIVARIFAGSFVGGALAARVLTPVPCAIEVDGVRAPFERTSLVCASVVGDLGLGMRLLYRAGEAHDRFHVVATPLGPSRLGPQLPIVLAGRPLLGRGRVDALAASLVLRFPEREGDGAYVLDGELFRTARVIVTPGPILSVLSAPIV
jgi:diacylglycerol kinase family enzyme